MSRLIALRKNGVLKHIWGDHLGGTTKSFDDGSEMTYTAYGETRSGGTNIPTDKRFNGQTLDLSTGLYWYGSRPYNPVLGRFIQRDTAVLSNALPRRGFNKRST